MSEPDGETTHPPKGVQSLKATDLTVNSLDRKHIHPIPCNHSFLSHFKGTELQIFFPRQNIWPIGTFCTVHLILKTLNGLPIVKIWFHMEIQISSSLGHGSAWHCDHPSHRSQWSRAGCPLTGLGEPSLHTSTCRAFAGHGGSQVSSYANGSWRLVAVTSALRNQLPKEFCIL